jgi:hypothetical protein
MNTAILAVPPRRGVGYLIADNGPCRVCLGPMASIIERTFVTDANRATPTSFMELISANTTRIYPLLSPDMNCAKVDPKWRQIYID